MTDKVLLENNNNQAFFIYLFLASNLAKAASSLSFIIFLSISSALYNKYSAKKSTGSSGMSLHKLIRPSVKCGTTLSIKYWRMGYDL